MKVKDLIKELSGFDQELDVWVSSDAEGNDFSKLHEVTPERMNKYNELCDAEDGDEDTYTNSIVIWMA